MSYLDSNAPPVLNVPLSTALFTVDTRDGVRVDNTTGLVVNPQNPYNINIQKNQSLFSGSIQRIALTDVVIPWNIPNVNPTNNALFLEKSDGTTLYTVEISPGFYSPSTLASAIQGELIADVALGTATWSVQFTDEAQFVISTISSGIQFRVLPKLGQPKGIATSYNNFPSVGQRSSTLATMMGFDYTGPQYSATVSGSYASMTYTRYVDIVSSILCKNQDVRDTSTSYFTGQNILARIYIGPTDNKPIIQYSGETEQNVTYNIAGITPFLLRERFDVPKDINWNPNEYLSSCNIQLKDEFGNQLYSVSEFPLWNGPANPPAVPSTAVRMNCGNSGFVQLTFLISEAGLLSGKYTQFG
jgi:hypothetical protein